MNQDQEIERLLSKLVEFKTTDGAVHEIKQCFDFIEAELDFFPFVKKHYMHNGVESRVWLTQDTKTPKILLNAHLDVVPGSEAMFAIRRVGDNFVGRGVSDMKFSIACFIVALRQLVKEGHKLPSLGVMITSDEEIGGPNGVGYLVKELGFKPEVVIIPDGADEWHVVEEGKGVFQVKVTQKGKSAHASRPWEGINAIALLGSGIAKISEEFPIPDPTSWVTTVNFGTIKGGLQANQVCDCAELVMDFRFVPSDSFEIITGRVKVAFPSAELEVLSAALPHYVDKNNKHVLKWIELIKPFRSQEVLIHSHGASDGRYFTAVGSTVILSKPMGGKIHTEEEWINIKSIGQFCEVVQDFIKKTN